MNFKVTKELGNVRPEKSSAAELLTTPTEGNLRLSTLGAEKIGVADGDFVQVVEGSDDNGTGFFIVKGTPGDKETKTSPVGAKLASTTGKAGTSLAFSSANIFKNLGGVKNGTKKVYSIGESTESDGKYYFRLTLVREEAPQERKKKSVEA